MRNKAAFLVLLAASLAIAQSTATVDPTTMRGKAAPALSVDHWLNTGNKVLTLAGLKGHVVVLDFWAYW